MAACFPADPNNDMASLKMNCSSYSSSSSDGDIFAFLDLDIYTLYCTIRLPITIMLTIKAVLPALLFYARRLLWVNASARPRVNLPLPPGSMGLPLIGETLSLIYKGSEFYTSRLRRHGMIYKTHILGLPVIRVVGASNVKKILMNENDLVTAYWPTSVRMLLGHDSVSMSIGELHRTKRRALQRVFNQEAMAHYVPIMQRVIRNCISSWCCKDKVFGYTECRNMTFTLAAEALVGFRVQPKEYPELLEVFEVFANNLFCLPLLCPGMGLAKGMSARKLLLKKIQECLERKKQDAAANQSLLNSGEGEDALSRLMKASGDDALTDSELKDLSLELLFAGHATTASAATSLLIKLHEHSDVLEKVLKELDQFGLVAGEQGDLTLAQLRQLEYTGAVIKEVLRLLPPIGGGFRKVIKTFELNGYQIPEGWTVAYSIRETHQTSPMFHNKQQFNPDRWLAKGDDEKFHYLPFGGGPRMCVGREFALLALRVFVVELVRSSTWSLMNGVCRMSYLPVPHPVDGLPVRFTERDLTKRQDAVAI